MKLYSPIGAMVLILASASGARAMDFEIPWYTVDGGGAQSSVSDQFQLAGTIGQPDAGAMSGGSFEVVGGFWSVASSVDETPTIIASDPPDNAIDARQPSDPNGQNHEGWEDILLTFDADTTGMQASDFVITSDPPGHEPTLDYIDPQGQTVLVGFDQRILLGAWTIVTYVPTGQSVRIAHLPADVNNDGTSAIGDVLKLIDGLNGQAVLAEYQSDIDRSGVASGADVLRVIDLLNGANAYDEWNLQSLPE